MKDKRVFKASEVGLQSREKWIADLSPDNVVNPDCYFFFLTRKNAEEFLRLVDCGMSTHEALHVEY